MIKTRNRTLASFASLGERILWAFVLIVSTAALAGAAPARVVVFGDSLTSGYQLPAEDAFPVKLGRKLKGDGLDVEVVNMSIPGETSAGALARLESIVQQRPDLVILEFGANDALRGIDPGLVFKNLFSISARFQAEHIPVLLAGMKSPPNMGEKYVAQFNIIFKSIADSTHASFYPFILDGIATKPEFNLGDGMHPNAKGVEEMVSRMYPQINYLVRWSLAHPKKAG